MTDQQETMQRFAYMIAVRDNDLTRLRARLDAADKVIKAADAHDNFDCPHYSEDRCKCGLTQVSLAKAWNIAKIQYDKLMSATEIIK